MNFPKPLSFFQFSVPPFYPFFLLASCILLLASDIHCGWSTQLSGVSSDLNSVDFVDSNTGWAVGNAGVILKTSDGGVTWTAQTSGTTTILRSVDFVNSSTGIVVGSDGAILKSTDSGATWFPLNSGITEVLYSVSWIDPNAVWAVGQSGRMRKSANGGLSWSNGDSGAVAPSVNLRSVFFVDSSTGFICGHASGGFGTVMKTVDGGATWTLQTAGIPNKDLKEIFFVSASTGWGVGSNGAVLKSGDGGIHWESQISTTANLNGVHFISTQAGYAVGDSGVIFKSTQNGTNFFADASTAAYHLYDLQLLNSSLGFAVGASGAILKFSTELSTTASTVSTPQGNIKAINNLFDPSKNEVTTIQYGILNSGKVILRIYSMQGRIVRTLVNNETLSAGAYTVPWDGRNDDGQTVASGIYLAHIEAPSFSKSYKIAIVQ